MFIFHSILILFQNSIAVNEWGGMCNAIPGAPWGK